MRARWVVVLAMVMTGCGSGGGGGGGATADNHPPIADAGPDQQVLAGTLVTLDGTASTDPDGDPLAYRWALVARPTGSTASLASAAAPVASFYADRDGTYVIELVVDDGFVEGSDTVTVGALRENTAPVAEAGPDQQVTTGTRVTLDGSQSRDADGDVLEYRWTLVTKPAASTAALADPRSVTPTFTADRDGTYVVSLIVEDGKIESAADSVTITAATPNTAPVAYAGADQIVTTGSLVTLDASESRDPDGDPLGYLWSFFSRPEGSTAVLSNATTVRATFTADVAGVYVVSLVVDDGSLSSAVDSVTITVSTPNTAPVADAGTDQYVATGSLVTLDATASRDADGDRLGYVWSLIGKPDDSTATLSSATTERPTFTADRDGIYVVSLVVNDGQTSSAADTVTVTATSGGGSCKFVQDGQVGTGVGWLPDGRLVTVGGVMLFSELRRFNSDLSGNERIALFSGSAHDLAVQPDGKIVVVGEYTPTEGGTRALLRRFDSNGVADSSFGTDGVVLFGSLARAAWGYAVALQPDGKILLGGRDRWLRDAMLIARFNADGSLDASFNGGFMSFDSHGADAGISDLAVQADGKIVATGTSASLTQDLVVVRVTASGQLDASFGDAGIATYDGGEWDAGKGIAVDSNGRILVTGHSSLAEQSRLLVMRFTARGTRDDSFGSGGVVVGGAADGIDVVVGPDGKIIVVGRAPNGQMFFEVALVARFNPDGTPDLRFGSSGRFLYDGGTGDDWLDSIVLAADGAMVAVGASNVISSMGGVSNSQILLVRLYDACN